MKKLQEDYFKKGTVQKDVYDRKRAELEKKISELDTKLKPKR